MLEAYKSDKHLGELEVRLPGDTEQVIQALKNVMEEQTPETRALMILARAYVLRESFDEAKRALEALLSLDPENCIDRRHG